MARWTISIPEKTDRAVRTYIARKGGKKGDLSKFVDQAVRGKIFDETVRQIKTRNAKFDQDEMLKMIDEAVDWSRANNT